jgi:hypothetical protein
MPLTDAEVRDAKFGIRPDGAATKKPYKMGDAGGLFLEVPPSGRKRWRMKYRFGGKEKRLSFGVYPDISLNQARAQRDTARGMLAAGIDPGELAKVERIAQRGEQARQLSTTRFMVDSDAALSFRLGNRRLALTPAETVELRAFLDSTRGVNPKR